MTINEAEKLARDLMKRHGLEAWRFVWEDTPKARGVCHYNVGIITLHSHLLSDDTQFMATLLHELSHCLTPDEKEKHGPRWHAKLIELIRDSTWNC